MKNKYERFGKKIIMIMKKYIYNDQFKNLNYKILQDRYIWLLNKGKLT